jgi:hypothetical protein
VVEGGQAFAGFDLDLERVAGIGADDGDEDPVVGLVPSSRTSMPSLARRSSSLITGGAPT